MIQPNESAVAVLRIEVWPIVRQNVRVQIDLHRERPVRPLYLTSAKTRYKSSFFDHDENAGHRGEPLQFVRGRTTAFENMDRKNNDEQALFPEQALPSRSVCNYWRR